MANQNNKLRANNSSSATVRDWQHAARMFTDSNQIYGPKQKFLFHVAFHINKNALKNITLGTTYSTQINMLVKSVSLPKFTIATDTANQYNRKKNIQQKVSYESISLKFHDDNLGLINQLWQNYYGYYYADPASAGVPGAFNRTAIKKFNYIRTPYGLDNGSTAPFFDYITIYQMAQGNYVSYKLINPIFNSWNHNGLDYAGQGTHDNDCSIQFEAVEYGNGKIQAGDPEGFALQNYDQVPSPLTHANQTSASLADISTTPTLDSINTIPDNKSSIINNALKSINIYTNSKAPTQSTSNIIDMTKTSASTPNNNNLGVAFSGANNSTPATTASSNKLTSISSTPINLAVPTIPVSTTSGASITPLTTIQSTIDKFNVLNNGTPLDKSLSGLKSYWNTTYDTTSSLLRQLTPYAVTSAQQNAIFKGTVALENSNNAVLALSQSDIGSGNTTLLAKLEKLSNEDAIAYLDVWVAFATTGLDFFSRANNKSGLATGGGQ